MRRHTIALLAVTALASIGLACTPDVIPGSECSSDGALGYGARSDRGNLYQCRDGVWKYSGSNPLGDLIAAADAATPTTTPTTSSTPGPVLPTPQQVAGCYMADPTWGDGDLQVGDDGTLHVTGSFTGTCGGLPTATRGYVIAADATAAAAACDGGAPGSTVAAPVRGAVYRDPGLDFVFTCALVAGGVPSGGDPLPTVSGLAGCYTSAALEHDIALYTDGTWVTWPASADGSCSDDPGASGQFVIAPTVEVAAALCSATPGGTGFLGADARPLLGDPQPVPALAKAWACG